MPPTRSRKKTAAASVELTTAPASMDSIQGSPSRKWAATPMTPAVTATPKVARLSAGHAAAR